MIVNSGNANTCNADGEEKAAAMCELAAKELNIPEEDVIVASTGVIGMVLDLEPIASHAKELAQALSYDGAHDAANAILTTDTQEKEIAVRFELGGKTCTIAGMAKGSGMIHPNMATMLCFLTTDAAIDPEVLQKALSAVVEDTFNMVSIDGDTSTNDMACIMANGLAGNPEINSVESEEYQIFSDACRGVSLCRRCGQTARREFLSHRSCLPPLDDLCIFDSSHRFKVGQDRRRACGGCGRARYRETWRAHII